MQPEYEMKILPASSRVEICQLNAVLFFTTLQTFWSKKQVSGVGRSIIGGRIYSYIRIIKSPPNHESSYATETGDTTDHIAA